MKKLNRFHIDIYTPEWGRESILKFSKELSSSKLELSFHARRKLQKIRNKNIRQKISNLIESLDFSSDILLDYVFEFYANEEMEVKKVCYRIPLIDHKFDLILVISLTGKVVTLFTNYELDKHRSLNRNLYTRGDNVK